MNSLILCMLMCSVTCITGWGSKALDTILNSKLMKCDNDKNLNLDVSGIDVYFYDFQNSIEMMFPINQAASGILSIPTLDKVKKKIFIFVGGFKSNINGKTEKRIKDTFTNFPNSYLIIIDHSAYTNDQEGYITSYKRSVKYVYYIGKRLAQMLADLSKNMISPKYMHCIGHSLGSQILGHTGDNFIKLTGQKISRITALDPAGPCFSKKPIQEQIRSGVADYVEIYHCNAGVLGTSSVLGDINFFVNKGVTQPNCGTFQFPKVVKCNHKTCVNVWTASVAHPDWFVAYKCDNYKQFKTGKCSSNHRTIAGFWNPCNSSGVYYFSTDGYNIN